MTTPQCPQCGEWVDDVVADSCPVCGEPIEAEDAPL